MYVLAITDTLQQKTFSFKEAKELNKIVTMTIT